MTDISQEFFSTVNILRAHLKSQPTAPPSAPRSAVDARIPSTARDIARTLRATSKLTVRLRKLTQRKGLFDDPTAEINEITTVLKKNVKHLQAKLTALMKVINATCKSRTILEHWNIVVDVLQMQLMGATRMLQNALRLRTKQLKEQQAKRGVYSESQWTPLVQLDTPLFGKAPPAHSGPLSGGSAGAGGGIGAGAGAGPGVGAGSGMRGRPQRPGLPPQSGMRHHRTHHQHTTASIPPPPPPPATTGFRAQQAAPPAWPGASSTAGGGGGLRKRQGAYDQGIQTTSASSMQQAETMAAFPHIDRGATAQQLAAVHYAKNRYQDALEVEATITEMGQTMATLAETVQQHNELTINIAQDMEQAAHNVEKGQNELVIWFQDVSRHRRFIIYVFAILVVIIFVMTYLNVNR